MNKKGFTLIEIVLALIIASIASAYVIKTVMSQNFKEELVKFQDNLQVIIEDGIASPQGYASGGGNPCSPNSIYNYTNLTTEDLFNCLDQGNSWNELELTTSTPKYITNTRSGFMNQYGGFGTTPIEDMGCGIEVIANPSDVNGFYILVDCSRIAPLNINNQDETDRRRLLQVEEAIEFLFARKLEYMYVNHNRTATLLNGTGTGSDADGIVWGEFRH